MNKETKANKPPVPAVYSAESLRKAGYDPAQLLPRLEEVMAMFTTLVKLQHPNPDALLYYAWKKSAELIEEVKL